MDIRIESIRRKIIENIRQEAVESRICELEKAGMQILSVAVHPKDFMCLLIEYSLS